MKKLKLNVERLEVDSFVAGAAGERAGTVRAREYTRLVDDCPIRTDGCTDPANTCGCGPDTSVNNPCFCTEYQTCWNCQVA